jgi:DNA-binding transcriptional regulator YdaS (Cro superfamily)
VNSDDFVAALKKLGCEDDAFANFLSVSLRSVQDWKMGRREIPRYVEVALGSLSSGAAFAKELLFATSNMGESCKSYSMQLKTRETTASTRSSKCNFQES